MQYTDVLNVIQQYQNEGNDLAAIAAATQSLMDTGKTPLGLNQWKLTDKPRMEEFNEDNRIIDEQLRNKVDKGAPKIYQLPLLDDFAANVATFHKNALNEVTVKLANLHYIDHRRFPGSLVNVAQLPEKFYPRESFNESIGVFVNSGGGVEMVITRLNITPTGLVRLISSATNANCILFCGETRFLAVE